MLRLRHPKTGGDCPSLLLIMPLLLALAWLPTGLFATSYQALLPELPDLARVDSRADKALQADGSVSLSAKPLRPGPQRMAQSAGSSAAAGQPAQGAKRYASNRLRKVSPSSGSQFGKVRRVTFIADYVLLRAVNTYQRHVFRQNDALPIVAKHKSGGIDFDYEELRVSADLGGVRFGGTFYGAEESGAKLFGEWLVSHSLYLGCGLAAVTSHTHFERYRKDSADSGPEDDDASPGETPTGGQSLDQSDREKWNTYALSSYAVYRRPFYELKGELGLSRKRHTRQKRDSLRAAGIDNFHRDFRSGFAELSASVIVPITPSLDAVWSYTYYRERMYKGVQIEGTVESAVDGQIENHYFDVLQLRYTH